MKKLLSIAIMLFSLNLQAQFVNFEQISPPLESDSRMVKLKNKVLFSKALLNGGGELWVSDGTLNGTGSLLPFNQMIVRYGFGEIMNDELYFTGFDSLNGNAIWKTDGTNAGTVMVKDIHPSKHWNLGDFGLGVVYNGKYYFRIDDGTHGFELWVSDGTSLGTKMVKDINPHGSATVSPIIVFNNKLLFEATDSNASRDIWTTDGTEVNTKKFIDFSAQFGLPSTTLSLSAAKVFNNQLYFIANNYLFVTDGTAAGTQLLSDTNGSRKPFEIYNLKEAPGHENVFFREMNGKLYFVAGDNMNAGGELWVTDGTKLGTQKVKDILLGPQGGVAGTLGLLNNSTLLFSASEFDKNHNNFIGYELWKSDGTSQGTVKLKELDSTTTANVIWPRKSTVPKQFLEYKGKVYFSGPHHSQHLRYLWETDGTTIGTRLVKDSVIGTYNKMTLFNGRMYFQSSYPGSQALWQSDGTLSGTFPIKPFGDTTSNVIFDFYDVKDNIILNDKLIMRANYGDAQSELWALTTFPLSVQSQDDRQIQFDIYPNPASKSLKIKTKDDIKKVELFDLNGKRLLSSTEKNLDISSLGNGIYFLSIQTNHGIGTAQFQINR